MQIIVPGTRCSYLLHNPDPPGLDSFHPSFGAFQIVTYRVVQLSVLVRSEQLDSGVSKNYLPKLDFTAADSTQSPKDVFKPII